MFSQNVLPCMVYRCASCHKALASNRIGHSVFFYFLAFKYFLFLFASCRPQPNHQPKGPFFACGGCYKSPPATLLFQRRVSQQPHGPSAHGRSKCGRRRTGQEAGGSGLRGALRCYFGGNTASCKNELFIFGRSVTGHWTSALEAHTAGVGNCMFLRH